MIEALLKNIAGQNLSGTLLVLALVVIFFLYKETKNERNARLKDIKEVWQEDIRFRSELKTLLDSILEILRDRK